jgi:hypothetical protein
VHDELLLSKLQIEELILIKLQIEEVKEVDRKVISCCNDKADYMHTLHFSERKIKNKSHPPIKNNEYHYNVKKFDSKSARRRVSIKFH